MSGPLDHQRALCGCSGYHDGARVWVQTRTCRAHGKEEARRREGKPEPLARPTQPHTETLAWVVNDVGVRADGERVRILSTRAQVDRSTVYVDGKEYTTRHSEQTWLLVLPLLPFAVSEWVNANTITKEGSKRS